MARLLAKKNGTLVFLSFCYKHVFEIFNEFLVVIEYFWTHERISIFVFIFIIVRCYNGFYYTNS